MNESKTQPSRRPRSARRIFYASAGLFVLVASQLLALKALPNSTSDLERAPPAEIERRPSPDFRVGSLQWDVAAYAVDPKLEEFRQYFRTYSRTESGLAASLRLAAQLDEDLPWGEPLREFLYGDYDPVTAFRAHRKGEPGHCVTRSGFLAAILLAAGVPARVVQFVPYHGKRGGHTVVEVWDQEHGWVLVDPRYNGCVGKGNRPCSAAEALESPRLVRWLPNGRVSRQNEAAVAFYEGEKFPLLEGHLCYPEPWLYTRSGTRTATWPLRGKFLLVGPWNWRFGPAQTVLRSGIVLSGVAAGLFGLVWVARVRRSRRLKAEAP